MLSLWLLHLFLCFSAGIRAYGALALGISRGEKFSLGEIIAGMGENFPPPVAKLEKFLEVQCTTDVQRTVVWNPFTLPPPLLNFTVQETQWQGATSVTLIPPCRTRQICSPRSQ